MNDRVVFIADAFADQLPGGGELNNDILIKMLGEEGLTILPINSGGVVPLLIEHHANDKFIVANFMALREDCRNALYDKKYIIYEHDHKYLKSRNPAAFSDYEVPPDDIINAEFYKNALAVICQTQFHADIVKKNLNLDNIISVGGNLWSDEILDLLQEISEKPKEDKCSIMISNNWHKNTDGAVKFCESNDLPFELIQPASYKDFLSNLGKNTKLVFFPHTPETLSRIVVEARMMGMGVVTSNQVGATKEEWFQYKGAELIDIMRRKKTEICNTVRDLLNGE
tara:strand:+ start:8921 stop:9769 length:849 start_codon:yes stop_codon:yes gene_type:complete